ncbi:MAG TPA: glutathione S-transferase family protein [Caulobacteraceae bacterium]|nr:glutathione S-transferase family protein [Caulobacteraceae bacterium]
MLKLYEHPLSPYAQKIKIALREKGLEFQVALPEGLGAGGAAGPFAEASPRAEVPVLIDGDLSVFESPIILQYLEENYPAHPLLPAHPSERARARMIEEVMDTHFEAVNWAMGEVNWFGRASGAQADALKATAARQTAGYHAWLERALGARAWFNGEAFGYGDLCVAPFIATAAARGDAPPLGTALARWFVRAQARSSVADTLAEARGFDIGASNIPELLASGLFKRQYRDHRLEWMLKSGGLEIVLEGLKAGNIRFHPDFR